MYQTEAEVFAFIYKMPSSCWPPPMSFLFGVADCTSAATWLCLFDVENINEKYLCTHNKLRGNINKKKI